MVLWIYSRKFSSIIVFWLARIMKCESNKKKELTKEMMMEKVQDKTSSFHLTNGESILLGLLLCKLLTFLITNKPKKKK